MATIADLESDVALELGNRADINSGSPSRIDNWLARSYRQVGSSYRFSTADATQQSQMTPGIGIYAYPPNARAIIGITIVRSDGSAITVDMKDLTYVRKYNLTNASAGGPPSIAATFGNSIFFAPVPDNSDTYTMIIDYWQKPLILNPISTTLLQVPDDWLEIVTYGAILRGHSSLLERDKAQMLQQLLFGLTVPGTGKVVPGLMAVMYSRYQAEAPFRDWGMAPSAARRGYTSTG